MPQSQKFLNNVAGFQSQAKHVVLSIAKGKTDPQAVANLFDGLFKILGEMVDRIDALENKIESASGPGSAG